MYLVDTNVWLELLLEQERAGEVQRFLQVTEAVILSITEFSLYSIGVILTPLGKDGLFQEFLTDTIESSGVRILRLNVNGIKQVLQTRERFGLDFDDAYQYVAAERYDLILVSFDRDFDRTERRKKTPAELSLP